MSQNSELPQSHMDKLKARLENSANLISPALLSNFLEEEEAAERQRNNTTMKDEAEYTADEGLED